MDPRAHLSSALRWARGFLRSSSRTGRTGEQSPSRAPGVRPYGGAMAHRRRSIIRFLFIALFLARSGESVRL